MLQIRIGTNDTPTHKMNATSGVRNVIKRKEACCWVIILEQIGFPIKILCHVHLCDFRFNESRIEG